MLNPNPRLKMMIDKLYDQVQRDCIGNEWAEKFILDMRERMKQNFTLSEKQESKIEELFEKY